MVELREAGKTGERGWTERAGFSHYVPARSCDSARASGPACGRSKDDGDKCTGDCPPDANVETARSRRSQDDRPIADRKRHREKRRERGKSS
jgi:hypothetical protein